MIFSPYQSRRFHAEIHVAKLDSPISNRVNHSSKHRFPRPIYPPRCRKSRSPYVSFRLTQNYLYSKTHLNTHPDYPRTLREWSRRLEANLTPDMLIERYPELRDRTAFESFKRKWQYLFAYAGAGFAKGYITCHMLTFTKVRFSFLLFLSVSCSYHGCRTTFR
jgi:cyclopropane-fatty-acyl-phospholipid synthase